LRLIVRGVFGIDIDQLDGPIGVGAGGGGVEFSGDIARNMDRVGSGSVCQERTSGR
jgi:hypothetical protein